MGYGQSPWTFKGRALYQLQLVKTDEARKYIPPELKLVEFFGYTLGGVYLARYDDSPAGAFDECVVMAGLVWNPPTSCAWAARVFVNNREARDHGVTSVGLPSRLASFKLLPPPATTTTHPHHHPHHHHTRNNGKNGKNAWWQQQPERQQQQQQQPEAAVAAAAAGSSSSGGNSREVVELRNVQPGRRGLPDRPVALLQLPAVSAAGGSSGFLGPRMRLSLPSFSGGTQEYPSLLQYSCDLQTNIMPVAPMQVLLDTPAADGQQQQQQQQQQHNKRQQQRKKHPEALDMLLNGRPLMCLAFSDMVMKVEEPQRLQLPEPTRQQHSTAALQPAFAAMVPGASSSSTRV